MTPDRHRRARRSFVPLALLALLAGAAAANGAGGTVADGNATFTITAYGAAPTADLKGLSSSPATDHLFRSGWWYRFEGEGWETPLPAPDTESFEDDEARLAWQDLRGDASIQLSEDVVIDDLASLLGHPGGYVLRSLVIRNLTDQPLEVDLFHYADLDIADQLLDDRARLVSWNRRVIRIEDDGGDYGVFVGGLIGDLDGSSIKTRVLSYTANLHALLNDTLVTELDDSGLPFGPGDFTAAIQFHLVLAPDEVRNPYVWLGVNFAGVCNATFGVFCDGFQSGDLRVWSPTAP